MTTNEEIFVYTQAQMDAALAAREAQTWEKAIEVIDQKLGGEMTHQKHEMRLACIDALEGRKRHP
jgi:hypothetical protein